MNVSAYPVYAAAQAVSTASIGNVCSYTCPATAAGAMLDYFWMKSAGGTTHVAQVQVILAGNTWVMKSVTAPTTANEGGYEGGLKLNPGDTARIRITTSEGAQTIDGVLHIRELREVS